MTVYKDMDNIRSILQGFAPISLDEMSRVRLMNRIDTKYVTTLPRLIELLETAGGEYRVQETGGLRDMPYYTCYFDTPDRDMFAQHQRGRKARQKIRMRVYENSGTAFLEIKDKDNRGRTDKKRVPADDADEQVMRHSDFIRAHSHYAPESLTPQVRNRFRRITLVNCLLTERLTIDTGLCFHNLSTGYGCSLEGLVIIELKRDGNTRSPAGEMLHGLHIHPSGFSKYCMGMALTDRQLRQNRLKPRLRMLERMLCPDGHNGRSVFQYDIIYDKKS